MNNPRHPLRINVGFLLHAQIGYNRDIHFEYPQISLEDEPFSDFKGTARVSRTPQGILVQGDFTATTTGTCVRCLKDLRLPLKAEFSELYAFNHRSVTESELVLSDDANIDLEPIAREYLVIEIPISAVCTPDCKGLCPVCGEDRNRVDCGHNGQEAD